MRLLVIADAGIHSGFGTVTHAICERLVTQYGHDVHVLAVNWQGDHVDTPLKLYLPTQKERSDVYGESRYIELLGKLMPDALLFINDPAIVLSCLLDNRFDPDRVLWNGFGPYKPPIIAYLPIDGYESPRRWDQLAERVIRVAMSRFGQRQMPEAPVIWHGVDSQVFRPLDKREAKQALGLDPDRFLVLRVDKNSMRKNYADTWAALRPVLRKYADIDVFFHTRPVTPDGVNLIAYIGNDEDIRDRLILPPQGTLGGFVGWTQETLATLYAAADLFVSTSWGEGFGLTILEAMACGTPVVAQDCSSITEVVGPGGVLIQPQRRIAAPMGQMQCLPNVKQFSAAIERLYLDRGRLARLGEAATAHARTFSWDIAARRFNDVLVAAVTPPESPAAA